MRNDVKKNTQPIIQKDLKMPLFLCFIDRLFETLMGTMQKVMQKETQNAQIALASDITT